MPQKNNQQTSDRVPEDLLAKYNEKIIAEIESYSKHDDFRKRVKEIVEDCTNSVDFMDKVKGYAGREIDERIFKNGKAILGWVISVIVAGVVGAVITKYF